MDTFREDEHILVWGYTAGEVEYLKAFHAQEGFPPPRPLFEEHLDLTIGEILAGGTGRASRRQPPVRIILLPKASTDAGIKAYLAAFRGCGLPRPIFAAVTDTSEGWTFNQLAGHLMEEQAELLKSHKPS